MAVARAARIVPVDTERVETAFRGLGQRETLVDRVTRVLQGDRFIVPDGSGNPLGYFSAATCCQCSRSNGILTREALVTLSAESTLRTAILNSGDIQKHQIALK